MGCHNGFFAADQRTNFSYSLPKIIVIFEEGRRRSQHSLLKKSALVPFHPYGDHLT
jgi:hypothetical protein